MSTKLRVSQDDAVGAEGVLLYRLAGPLTNEHEAYQFLEAVREAVSAGRNRIVLNLAGLTRLTSPGVGILAAAFTSVQRGRGALVLSETPKHCETVLSIVGLYALIPHESSDASAIQRARA